MGASGRFLMAVILGIVALAALYGASKAPHESTLYFAGLALFVGALAYVMAIVKRACDEFDRQLKARK